MKSTPVKFFLQFDESTDVSSCAVLLGFNRYVHLDMIKEEIRCAKILLRRRRVRICLTRFLESSGLGWHRVYQVAVDGAPATMGARRGFRGLRKRRKPEHTSRSLHHSSVFSRMQDTASFLESSFGRCCQNRKLHRKERLCVFKELPRT